MHLKHFDINEFDSPDLKGSGEQMQVSTLTMLDKARELANTPFRINSGFRTKERNKRVGGKTNSSHLLGYAADIKCRNSKQRTKIVQALLFVGFNRIGIAKTFIHVDNDPNKTANVMWVY